MILFRGTHPDQSTIGYIKETENGWIVWPENDEPISWNTYKGPYKNLAVAKRQWWRNFGKGWTWEKQL